MFKLNHDQSDIYALLQYGGGPARFHWAKGHAGIVGSQ